MKKLIITAVFITLSATAGFAGNVQTFGIGAKATALGEAVVAHSDDPFAVYYNPAGLTLSDGPTLSVGAIYYKPVIDINQFKVVGDSTGIDYNAASGRPSSFSSSKDDDNVAIPHLGYSMPINEKFYFGIATYAPYGLHVTWDKNPLTSPGASYAWESYYGRQVITPTIAYKINDKFSAGFGISMGKSVSEAGKTYDFAEEWKNPASYPADMLASGEATANIQNAMLLDGATLKLDAEDSFNYSFNAGVMYAPTDAISLGLTYRGRTKTDFNGDLTLNNVNLFDNTGTFLGNANLDGDVSMEYDHPESVQTGVRYTDGKKFAVEFDLTWTRWSILEEQVENATINMPDGSVMEKAFIHDRDWEDTLQYKLGVEYSIIEAVALRIGYTYDETPIPDDTFELGWPDTDRSVYNIGCGWDINENWTLDSVLQFVNSSPRRKATGKSRELNESYLNSYYDTGVKVSLEDEGTLWGFGTTLAYHF